MHQTLFNLLTSFFLGISTVVQATRSRAISILFSSSQYLLSNKNALLVANPPPVPSLVKLVNGSYNSYTPAYPPAIKVCVLFSFTAQNPCNPESLQQWFLKRYYYYLSFCVICDK